MSTLSGKPANPADLSGYAPRSPTERQTGAQSEGLDSERQDLERQDLEHQDLERHADDAEEIRSPYAPKHGRRVATTGPDLAAASEAAPLAPGVPQSEWPYTDARGDVDSSPPMAVEENVAHDDFGTDAYLGTTPSLQPGAPGQPVAAHSRDAARPATRPAAARSDTVRSDTARSDTAKPATAASDHDLERLESSLRWLQRQEMVKEAVTRMPRGPNLPLAGGLAPLDPGSRRLRSDRPGGELHSPLSLEPERMAPPPALAAGTGNVRWSLYIFLASAVMAGTTYYLTAGGFWKSEPAQPQLAASASAPAAMQTAALGRQESVGRHDFAERQMPAPRPSARPEPAGGQDARPTVARDDDPEVLREIALQSIKASKASRLKQADQVPEGEIVAMLRPDAAPAKEPAKEVSKEASREVPKEAPKPTVKEAVTPAPAPPSPVVRTLDPDVIALLVKQGEQFVATGDLVTARTVFQRAAEAGDAYAAMALGATYDPNVLAKLGVLGMGADVDKARTWYQRAESLGSQEATQRLSLLANR